LARRAKRLLISSVVAAEKVIQRAKSISSLNCSGKNNIDTIVEKVHSGLGRVCAALRGDVINRLEEVDIPPQRRGSSRADVGDTRNAYRRSDSVVDRCVKDAMRDWKRASLRVVLLMVVMLLTETV